MKFPTAMTKLTTIALSTAMTLGAVSAVAQDGTAGSTPEPSQNCAIAVSTFTGTSSATPQASPMSATPIGSPAATPIAASDPLTDDLRASVTSILDCMSENNVETLTQITGPQFRGSWLGFDSNISDDDFSAIMPMMPTLPYALVDVQNASGSADSASATVTYTAGRQLVTADWTFSQTEVDGNKVWMVEQEAPKPTAVPDDATSVDLKIADGSFAFSPAEAKEGNVVINVSNTGKQPHEVLIVRAPNGTEAADFASADTGIPEGSAFIAQATIPAGSEGAIVLSDLRSGTYTVVDMLPDASGMPNVSSGMITTFTVKD